MDYILNQSIKGKNITVILEKDYTDTLEAASNPATCKVVKVAFTIS